MENVLRRVEAKVSKNPHYVWKFLCEGDLLVTQSGGCRFIICVKKYVPGRRMIKIKFLYCIEDDEFVLSSGLECPELVERGPYPWEVEQLKQNLDYIANNT